MQRRAGSRAAAFARSVLLVGALVVGVPWLLIWAARERFGGGAPFHGVPSPADWDAGRIRSALSDRLTDQTVADIVIRTSLLVAWAAVIVLLLTVFAELVHMLRHDGLPMPDVRGLGLTQKTARVIASGLLVIIPMFASPSRAVARDGAVLVPEPRAAANLVVETPSASPVGSAAESDVAHPVTSDPTPAATSSLAPENGATLDGSSATSSSDGGTYVVRAGDSIYAIAERVAGPDAADVAAYAERLVDLNLGTRMPDGQHFTNAAYIDVGWVLRLPTAPVAEASAVSDVSHLVERGESLWSIADEELGDAERWPEIYEANEGRTFDDGRVLDDPDLIHPGWNLDLPVDAEVAPAATPAPAETPAPALPDNVWIPKDEAGAAGGSEGLPGGAAHQAADAESAATDAAEIARAPGAAVDEPAPVASGAELPPPARVPSSSAAVPLPAPAADGFGQPADEAPRLLTYGRAAMLSAGVLTLLAVRRRNQLRRARPRARLPEPRPSASATERVLRAIDPGERFERVEAAVRAVAPALVEQGQRVVAVVVGADGELELRVTGIVELAPPWTGGAERWELAAATPIELLAEAARGVGAPCPTLVQIGRDTDGRDVYVDLEALEALEVGGPGDHADAVVAAIAATLAGSVAAEVTTLVGLGISDEVFLGHRLHRPVRDAQRAFEAAADAIGTTAAMRESTFELRTRAGSGETWEPAVVLAGSAAGTLTPPRSRHGLAVVSASPIHGPSSRLAPDGDVWELKPAGIRLVPVGLSADDISAIADLIAVPEPPPAPEPDDDVTIVPEPPESGRSTDVAAAEVHDGPLHDGEVFEREGDDAAPDPAPEWALLVRLLGPVEVVSPDAEAVSFERSKTRELVAWLATHRERSTRTAARTALWELDVRDATFANVVSEARRSLARLVEPPVGEEWVGRTMTDDLPLHELVLTDADLLEHALDAALLQPPALAIATLGPAVERITGMPFEGTSYLWPDAEGLTSNLVLLATSAAAELAAHCLSVGDVEGVFAATGRGLRVLPGHEELIGLRMQAHARAGDHAGVRQEWESYERVITADPWSDGEPSPKLVELRRELLNPSR